MEEKTLNFENVGDSVCNDSVSSMSSSPIYEAAADQSPDYKISTNKPIKISTKNLSFVNSSGAVRSGEK